MARKHSNDELEIPRAGRLDESAEWEAINKMLRGPRGPGIRLRTAALKQPSKRTTSPTSGPGYRALSLGTAPTSVGASTFHLRMASTSRKPAPQIPREVRRGHRVGLWPTRTEIFHLKTLSEAKRHSGARMWSLPSGHAFLKTPAGQLMASNIAKTSSHVGREFNATKRALDRCRQHQRYIERSGGYSKTANDIERDERGPICTGNIGDSPKQREAFWLAANIAENRRDSRVQDRIIIELPHWVSSADRRAIIERFGQEFTRQRLGWFAAAHKPDEQGDSRNFHAHFVIGTRPILTMPSHANLERSSAPDWVFAPTKNRNLQGPDWVTYLRRRYAEIVNEVAEQVARRGDKPIERLFYPGRATEIGILSPPGEHLGPARSALLRRDAGAPQRSVPPRVADILTSCIRAHTQDLEVIARTTEELDILLETFEPQEHTFSGRFECVKNVDAARNAVAACAEFLKSIFSAQNRKVTVLHDSEGKDAQLELIDVVWRFSRAGAAVASALASLEKYKEEMAREEVQDNFMGEFAKGPATLEEVDPEWVFQELKQRLKPKWIPPKLENDKKIPVVRRCSDSVAIAIGDYVDIQLHFGRASGWHIVNSTSKSEKNLDETTYEVRFWRKLVEGLIETTTLSLGATRVAEILTRHGLSPVKLTGRQNTMEFQKPGGLLRLAADGRHGSLYGNDNTLGRVFEEIRRARSRLHSNSTVLQLLASRSRPHPEGDPTRVDRPVSLSTLLRFIDTSRNETPIERKFVALSPSLQKKHEDAIAAFHPPPNLASAETSDNSSSNNPKHSEGTPSNATSPETHTAKNGIFDGAASVIRSLWNRISGISSPNSLSSTTSTSATRQHDTGGDTPATRTSNQPTRTFVQQPAKHGSHQKSESKSQPKIASKSAGPAAPKIETGGNIPPPRTTTPSCKGDIAETLQMRRRKELGLER
jgi:hypothetical protein